MTRAELLGERIPGWDPPAVGRRAVMQTHCHQHAVMGIDADRALLSRADVDLRVLDSGCCGLAGNFGFEAGHYDVSMACAEPVLLPEVRAADDDVVLLADGFSCRVQIEQGDSGRRRAAHSAELLAGALAGRLTHGADAAVKAASRTLMRPAGAVTPRDAGRGRGSRPRRRPGRPRSR